ARGFHMPEERNDKLEPVARRGRCVSLDRWIGGVPLSPSRVDDLGGSVAEANRLTDATSKVRTEATANHPSFRVVLVILALLDLFGFNLKMRQGYVESACLSTPVDSAR